MSDTRSLLPLDGGGLRWGWYNEKEINHLIIPPPLYPLPPREGKWLLDRWKFLVNPTNKFFQSKWPEPLWDQGYTPVLGCETWVTYLRGSGFARIERDWQRMRRYLRRAGMPWNHAEEKKIHKWSWEAAYGRFMVTIQFTKEQSESKKISVGKAVLEELFK